MGISIKTSHFIKPKLAISIYLFITILQISDLNQYFDFHIYHKIKLVVTSILINEDPIDIVYGWLNGSDPVWNKAFQYLSKKHNIQMRKKNFDMRFIEGDELRYSLRSIEMFAIHFIRYIFIIVPNTYTQIPCWLNTFHPKLKIISQRDIFTQTIPDEFQNDTNSIFIFNSNSIDNSIPSIPGLSDKFIYMNDDFFYGRKVEKSDFFDEKGRPKILVNVHNFNNVENEYRRLSLTGKNDFSGTKFNAVLCGTVILMKNKLNTYSNLDFYHVSFPYTKRLWKEAMTIFGNEINNTVSSPFRSVTDVLFQALALQYGLYKNQVIPVQFQLEDSRFVMISSSRNLNELELITKQHPKVFCINCDNTDFVYKSQEFLSSYFPNKSSFEL